MHVCNRLTKCYDWKQKGILFLRNVWFPDPDDLLPSAASYWFIDLKGMQSEGLLWMVVVLD